MSHQHDDCPRCAARLAELTEEVAYLRSELGIGYRDTEVATLVGQWPRPNHTQRGLRQAAIMALVLYRSRGLVKTHQQLMETVPSPTGNEDRLPKVTNVWAYVIKKAIGSDAIVNVQGVGYRMTPAGLLRMAEQLGEAAPKLRAA